MTELPNQEIFNDTLSIALDVEIISYIKEIKDLIASNRFLLKSCLMDTETKKKIVVIYVDALENYLRYLEKRFENDSEA